MIDSPNSAVPDPRLAPFVLVVTFHLKPEGVEEFRALLDPVLETMSHEPTFVNVVLQHNAEDPTHFLVYETWHDRANFFAVELQRPYRQAFEAGLPALLARPREAQVFEPVLSYAK